MRSDAPALGSLALEFLHTLRKTRRGFLDVVRTPETLAAWLITHAGQRAAAVLRDPLPPPAARLLLDEAQHLRRDIGVLVVSYAQAGAMDPGAAFGINRILAACPRSWLLATEAGQPVLVEEELGRGYLGSLSAIAEEAGRLVSTMEPGRIRPCAAASCGAWFVDRSKGGRRKWCSMAGCGNREKANIHRSKLRGD